MRAATLLAALVVLANAATPSRSQALPPPTPPLAPFVVVTHMSEGVRDGYGAHTRVINAAYAERHGYTFVVDEADHGGGGRDVRWNKVAAVRAALQSLEPGIGGAVMWLDADAAFTNFGKAAHELLGQAAPGEDLLLCRDLSVPRDKPTCAPVCLGTGAFILRNTVWSRDLLDRWWQSAEDDSADLAFGGSHEEAALARLYAAGWGGIRDRTKVFGPTAFNSVPPFLTDHSHDQLVLHASEEPSTVRALVFGRVAEALGGGGGGGGGGPDMRALLPELASLVRQGYEDAHAADPADSRVASVLASLVRDSGEPGSLQRAGGLLGRAMALSPGDAGAALAYGSFAAQYLGEWCAARDAFVAAVRLQPDSETAAQLLRGAAERCGRAARADKNQRAAVVYTIAGVVVACVMALVLCGGGGEEGGGGKGKKRK